MNNLQPNYQLVECDDQTAELHMAMAEMMGEDEKQANIKPRKMRNQKTHLKGWAQMTLISYF